ncbi:MAG: B12-binding domain-containing radical SAM protein [Deltaproteobacteria bacterium]|nr:B12-binding domain-containing radical SAM protein [Deltaproteobacteria bacterium]
MKTLLVYPIFPKTYWGMEYSNRLTGKRALLPPLGLLTVAALLPKDWSVRLVDMNIAPLDDDALAWADVVFVSAMQVQGASYHAVIARAHAAGKRVVVGGPYPTTDPERSADADAIVIGESEDLVTQLANDLEAGTLAPRYEAPERPDVARSPIPRYDLLDVDAYISIGLQWSRGCPFNCEFCDIIEVFGRVPRTKSPERLNAELDAIYATGFRGAVFIVDDNFIGNKNAVKKMLPHIESWMIAHKRPFDLYTEASLDLASHDDILAPMAACGFSAVFIGIETPSRESLIETQKRQNLHLDPRAAVEKITRAGLEVMAGFIVGFDHDDESCFELQREFIQGSPIVLAMVGILSVLPGTQLERRMTKEGRMRSLATGNQFGRTNFETRLDENVLLKGYGGVLAQLYEPKNFFARCLRTLKLLPKNRLAVTGYPVWFAAKTFLRGILYLGILGKFRAEFWKYIFKIAWHAPRLFVRGFAMAVTSEHLIRYTMEDVLPALRAPAEILAPASVSAPVPAPVSAPAPAFVRLSTPREVAAIRPS